MFIRCLVYYLTFCSKQLGTLCLSYGHKEEPVSLLYTVRSSQSKRGNRIVCDNIRVSNIQLYRICHAAQLAIVKQMSRH